MREVAHRCWVIAIHLPREGGQIRWSESIGMSWTAARAEAWRYEALGYRTEVKQNRCRCGGGQLAEEART